MDAGNSLLNGYATGDMSNVVGDVVSTTLDNGLGAVSTALGGG
jgi:hypothetical protein